jgi:hypothetical protein
VGSLPQSSRSRGDRLSQRDALTGHQEVHAPPHPESTQIHGLHAPRRGSLPRSSGCGSSRLQRPELSNAPDFRPHHEIASYPGVVGHEPRDREQRRPAPAYRPEGDASMQRSTCQFSAAAYACETARRRLESLSASTVSFVAELDAECVETHKAAAAIVGERGCVADSLDWATDFMIFASQHPEAFLELRRTIEEAELYGKEAPPLPPERRRPRLTVVDSSPAHSSTTKLLQSTKSDRA